MIICHLISGSRSFGWIFLALHNARRSRTEDDSRKTDEGKWPEEGRLNDLDSFIQIQRGTIELLAKMFAYIRRFTVHNEDRLFIHCVVHLLTHRPLTDTSELKQLTSIDDQLHRFLISDKADYQSVRRRPSQTVLTNTVSLSGLTREFMEAMISFFTGVADAFEQTWSNRCGVAFRLANDCAYRCDAFSRCACFCTHGFYSMKIDRNNGLIDGCSNRSEIERPSARKRETGFQCASVLFFCVTLLEDFIIFLGSFLLLTYELQACLCTADEPKRKHSDGQRERERDRKRKGNERFE